MQHPEPRQHDGMNSPSTQLFEFKRLGDCAFLQPSKRLTKTRHVTRKRQAFTLIEVILTIAMLVLLTSVFTATMFGTIGGRSLDEGALQFDTMLRMARADAANQGRRLRLTFTPDSNTRSEDPNAPQTTIRFEWEPQPLAQPGEFIPYENGSWTRTLPKEQVLVQQCKLTGESATQTLTYDSELMTDSGGNPDIQPVEFFPDGTCDSATFVLVSTDPDDNRTAVIELDGLNGRIQSFLFSPSEFDAYQSEKQALAEGDRAY